MFIELSEKVAEHLLEVVVGQIIMRGQTMKLTDRKKTPETYRILHEQFTNMITLHAEITRARSMREPDGVAGLTRHANKDISAIDSQTYQLALAEGIDPQRELLDIDPRANNPHCVHGVPFSTPCESCDISPNTEWRANNPHCTHGIPFSTPCELCAQTGKN